MKKMLACLLTITTTFVYAQTVSSVVHGPIKKIDAGAKTVAVSTVVHFFKKLSSESCAN